MMTDLIRASMFCDVNDIYAEDELQILANMEHTCRDVMTIDDAYSDSDNFLTLVASTTSNNAEPITTEQTTQLQATNQDCNLLSQCCHGDVVPEDTCHDFWSRIVQASTVDLSTFYHVCASDIFGNDYLQPIVSPKEPVVKAKQTTDSNSKQTTGSAYTTSRPPYSYAGCAVTAIYLSGKDTLSIDDIMDQLLSMFEGLQGIRRIYRKRVAKVLRTHVLFKQETEGSFRVVPGRVGRNTFQRQGCLDKERRNRYAEKIHHHFQVPSMLKDLGIELGETERSRTKPVKASQMRRKSSVSAKEVSSSASCGSDLEMPGRPCFHDDSDNEDELLIQHNGRSISPISLSSSQDRSSVCTDATGSSFEEKSCMDSLSAMVRNPTLVVPTPRYAVPTPSSYIPLRCQEYHIPNVGTFHLVDLYYNGQIIHKLI